MYLYEIMLICTDIGFERFYEIFQEKRRSSLTKT